jgi:hypothetical protein
VLNVPSLFQDNSLTYDECPLFSLHNESKGTGRISVGHMLYDDHNNILIIVFTGTSNGCLVGLDLEYAQTELNGLSNYTVGMQVHRGIYTLYQSIRPQLVKIFQSYLPKNPQIVITGHSLGGALSHICALDLAFYNPINYSFASPLVFNGLASLAYEKFVKHSYRIANISDLVTMSPLPIMPNKDIFCHVGTLVSFQKNLGEYSSNHSLAYAHEYNLI